MRCGTGFDIHGNLSVLTKKPAGSSWFSYSGTVKSERHPVVQVQSVDGLKKLQTRNTEAQDPFLVLEALVQLNAERAIEAGLMPDFQQWDRCSEKAIRAFLRRLESIARLAPGKKEVLDAIESIRASALHNLCGLFPNRRSQIERCFSEQDAKSVSPSSSDYENRPLRSRSSSQNRYTTAQQPGARRQDLPGSTQAAEAAPGPAEGSDLSARIQRVIHNTNRGDQTTSRTGIIHTGSNGVSAALRNYSAVGPGWSSRRL